MKFHLPLPWLSADLEPVSRQGIVFKFLVLVSAPWNVPHGRYGFRFQHRTMCFFVGVII